MWLKGKKLKTNEKTKEFFHKLLKKLSQLIQTHHFSEVVLGFKKYLKKFTEFIVDVPRADIFLFLSSVVLFAIVLMLFSLFWSICLFTC